MGRETTFVQAATGNVRRGQSGLKLRKESLSALVVVVTAVATLITENVDAIPAEAGVAGQVVVAAASVIAWLVARFTVPALTKGQQREIVAEAERLEAEQVRRDAPAELPVYDGPGDFRAY